MDAVLSVLQEKIDPKVLRRADTRAIRKKLLRTLTSEVFYRLFRDGRLNLSPGFGTVFLKQIREKDKKIFNKKTGNMVEKHVRGRKVVYKPGDFLRELL